MAVQGVKDVHEMLCHVAQSLVEGRWQPVDPTFGQARADATHLALIEGETLAELAPMVGLIGNLKARVLDVQTR